MSPFDFPTLQLLWKGGTLPTQRHNQLYSVFVGLMCMLEICIYSRQLGHKFSSSVSVRDYIPYLMNVCVCTDWTSVYCSHPKELGEWSLHNCELQVTFTLFHTVTQAWIEPPALNCRSSALPTEGYCAPLYFYGWPTYSFKPLFIIKMRSDELKFKFISI